jgi:hypothetical protein
MTTKKIKSEDAVKKIVTILNNLADGTDVYKVASAVGIITGKFYVEEIA